LFTLIGAVAFVLTTPIAFLLKRVKFNRRAIVYLGLLILGSGLIIRTGSFKWFDDSHISMVFIGNALNGIGMALLTTTVLPEMYENLETMEDFKEYDEQQLQIYLSCLSVIQNSLA
jgi:drug/metabolite transporter (DMT)-like permease